MEEQRERQQRTPHNQPNQLNSDEEWSDDLSEEESYYSDSESSVPEWESSVNDTTGELFFIDCHPFVTQNVAEKPKSAASTPPLPKTELRRSTRTKFLRLIRRSKRHSLRRPPKRPAPAPKVKFHDAQEGEEREVTLTPRATKPKNTSEGAPLCETLLGISIGTLSDGSRVMVAGFTAGSAAKSDKNVKIGDWLKTVNGTPVTFANIAAILEHNKHKAEIRLKLQRVAGVDVTKSPPINELNLRSQFVFEMVHFDRLKSLQWFETLNAPPLGVLYLNMANLSETANEFDDITYSFPTPHQNNPLAQSRGIYLTLNHLIKDTTQTQPKITTVLYRGQLAHVFYNCHVTKLLLLMLPGRVGVREANFICDEVIKMLSFLYDTLELAFEVESRHFELDHFFARFFLRLWNGNRWTTMGGEAIGGGVEFEGVLPAARLLHLPDEAQMQIDDALSELEASDYREWNEEPLDCQRLFTILGSALYHSGHLLTSHLPPADLLDITSFCRQFGFFHLSQTEPIKSIVYWRQVYPSSCRASTPLTSKCYLLLVGNQKDLLAVLMEAGGCTERPAAGGMGPDAFYVEEVQATLAHVQELGVGEVAERFLATNPGAQVAPPDGEGGGKRGEAMEALARIGGRRVEVTSILKRRSSDQVGGGFGGDDGVDTYSEDSGQSRVSSEMDDYEDGSHLSTSSFDISELRQSLLSEVALSQPQQLTSGNENVLFHYVQFIASEGLLVCPPDSRLQSVAYESILTNFRYAAHKIHSLFENTMRFKSMPAQDMAKSVMNKSLIAIKEHGVMFECHILDEEGSRRHKINYWVIGRLFYVPHPKEVYVCYQDTIPQNIIELAFKIDLSQMN